MHILLAVKRQWFSGLNLSYSVTSHDEGVIVYAPDMVLLLQKYTADYTEENATGHVGASRNKNKQLDELGVVTGMHDGVFGEDNEEEVDQKEKD